MESKEGRFISDVTLRSLPEVDMTRKGALIPLMMMAMMVVAIIIVTPIDGVDSSEESTATDSSIFAYGTGTADDPYTIENLEQLSAFRDSVNAGNAYDNDYIVIAPDVREITLDDGWIPIGDGARTSTVTEDTIYFGGDFNGNGCRIYNLNDEGYTPAHTKDDTEYLYGLFGFTYDATVENISIVDANITSVSSEYVGDSIGGLIGYGLGILNIADVEVSGTISGNDAIAGVVGRFYGTQLHMVSCFNEASVTSTGVNSKAGGITSIVSVNVEKVTFSNCNNGSSSTITGYNAGGLIGYTGGSDGLTISMTECVNGGTVKGIKAEGNQGGYAGGVIGYDATKASCTIKLEGVHNEGSITATNAAGGIVGLSQSPMSLNTTSNSGDITGRNAGGLIGGNHGSLTVSDSYILGTHTIQGEVYAGGIVGYSGGEVTMEYCSFDVGGFITIETTQPSSGPNGFGYMNGAAIGAIRGNNLTIVGMQDFDDYRLIAAIEPDASVYDVVLEGCTTTNIMTWRVGNVYGPTVQLIGSYIAGIESYGNRFTITADGGSQIGVLRAGAVEAASSLDEISFEGTSNGYITIAAGTTLVVGAFEQVSTGSDTYGWTSTGSISGVDATSVVVVKNEDSTIPYTWNGSEWETPPVYLQQFEHVFGYQSIQEAIDNAEHGANSLVYLEEDIVLENEETIDIPSGTLIQIDLNGHTITAVANDTRYLIHNTGNLDLLATGGGSINLTGSGIYGIIDNSGILDVLGGTYVSGSMPVMHNSGYATIGGVSDDLSMTISMTGGSSLFDISATGAVTITNGSFSGTGIASISEGGRLYITGGSFGELDVGSYVLEGYSVDENGNVYYSQDPTQELPFVAQVDNASFTDFAAALDAASSGKLLQLLKDVEINEDIVVTGQVTISLGTSTLKLGEGASLTVDDGGWIEFDSALIDDGNGNLNQEGILSFTESGQIVVVDGVLVINSYLHYIPIEGAEEENVRFITAYGSEDPEAPYDTQVNLSGRAILASYVPGAIGVYIDHSGTGTPSAYGVSVVIDNASFGDNMAIPVAVNPSIAQSDGNIPTIDFIAWTAHGESTITTEGYAKWYFMDWDYTGPTTLTITSGEVEINGGTWPSSFTNIDNYTGVRSVAILSEDGTHYEISRLVFITFTGYGIEGTVIAVPEGKSVEEWGAEIPEDISNTIGAVGRIIYEGDAEWDSSTTYHRDVSLRVEYIFPPILDVSDTEPMEGDVVELTIRLDMETDMSKSYVWHMLGSDGEWVEVGSSETLSVESAGTYRGTISLFLDGVYVGNASMEYDVTFSPEVFYEVTLVFPSVLGWDSQKQSVKHGDPIDYEAVQGLLPDGYIEVQPADGGMYDPVTQEMTVHLRVVMEGPEIMSSIIIDNQDGTATVSVEAKPTIDGVTLRYILMDVSTEAPLSGLQETGEFTITESGTYGVVIVMFITEESMEDVFGSTPYGPFDVMLLDVPSAPAEDEGYIVIYGDDSAQVTAVADYEVSADGISVEDTISVSPGGTFYVRVAAVEGVSYASGWSSATLNERPGQPTDVEYSVTTDTISLTTTGLEMRLANGEWTAGPLTGLAYNKEYSVEFRVASTETSFAGEPRTIQITTQDLPTPEAPSSGTGYTAVFSVDTVMVTAAEGYEIGQGGVVVSDVLTLDPEEEFQVRVAATEAQYASAWTGASFSRPVTPESCQYSITQSAINAGDGLQIRQQDGEWSSAINGLKPGTEYIVEFRLAPTETALAGTVVQSIITTESAPVEGLPDNPAPEVGAGFVVQYDDDAATVTPVDGYEISADAESVSGMPLVLGPGVTFHVRMAATDNANASGWTSNSLSQRPETPSTFEIVMTPTTISVMTAGVEIRIAEGDWGTTLVGLNPDSEYTIQYRTASTESSFAGDVKTMVLVTPPLSVPSAPATGEGYSIVYGADTATITPSAGYEISSDGSTTSESLVLGPGQAFSVRVAAGEESTESSWTVNSLADRPSAPTNPAYSVSRTGITAGTGFEIRIGDGQWGASISGLSSGTSYTVQFRSASTVTSFASEVAEVTVRTSSGGGSTVTPTPDPDPTPDEGETTVTTDEEGNTVTETVRPDGSSTTVTSRPDGSSTVTDQKPVEGGTQTVVTDSDPEGNVIGSTTTTVTETVTESGSTVSSTVVEKTDAEGNTTSTTNATYTSEDQSTVTSVTVTTDAEGNAVAQSSTVVTVEQADEGTPTVSADTVSGAIAQMNEATVSADQADRVIRIEASNESSQSVQVAIEPEAIQQIADSGATLEVSGQVGTISASTDVASSLSQRESAVTLSISVADKSQMAPVLQQIVGERPTYQLLASSGEDSIHELGGDVTISIPYELSEGEDPDSIVVFYVDDDGVLHAMVTSYADGVVTFVTDHFSYYAIHSNISESDEPEVPDTPEGPDSGDNSTALYAGIAIAVIAIVAVAAVVLRRRL